ncbi:MAG: KH domain-containing protein [Synechococcales bacterium]|nr:KH domain-containing protein [Synechococcales bacterium]
MSNVTPADSFTNEAAMPVGAQKPDYMALLAFLIHPFLDSPDALKLDCETSPRTGRVLVRLAIEGEDKGKVFGRGGRNLQAVRTVVQTAAETVGQSIHIEVFGSQSGGRGGDRDDDSGHAADSRQAPRRSSRTRSHKPS